MVNRWSSRFPAKALAGAKDLSSQTMVEWTPIEITKEVVAEELTPGRVPLIF